MRNKLEDEVVLQWLLRHDLIILSEIKISKLPHVPGFVPIIAKTVNPRRGGVAVLVRSSLYSDVCHIDNSYNDQLWFSFSSIPGVRFCGAYITPTSSPYFCESDIANIQAKTVDRKMRYVIMGDLNARFGCNVNTLVDDSASLSYNVIDPGVNDSGKKMIAICKDHDLVVVNNLSTESATFAGALTFRQRNKWISEVDLCITSKDLISNVTSFLVNQDTSLPSNHAPVSVQLAFPKRNLNIHQILTRSVDIGTYILPLKQLCRSPISYYRINQDLFTQKMPAVNPISPTLASTQDHKTLANELSDLLYDTSKECKMPPPVEPSYDPASTRWKRIMDCCDDGLLSKAIDWKGQFNPGYHDDEPQDSEDEF